jgi:hypothetical protein
MVGLGANGNSPARGSLLGVMRQANYFQPGGPNTPTTSAVAIIKMDVQLYPALNGHDQNSGNITIVCDFRRAPHITQDPMPRRRAKVPSSSGPARRTFRQCYVELEAHRAELCEPRRKSTRPIKAHSSC